MSYTLLREGDHLPAVGVLQKLLARTGASLTADGTFGAHTKTAVQEFQRPRRLNPDGVVGETTWPRVASGAGLSIVDCIDIFDPALLRLEANDIRRVGGNPILISGMSGGVEQVVSDILARAGSGSVFLLRFHGHGRPGLAAISAGRGRGSGVNLEGEHHATITTENIASLRPVLARLRGIFGRYGCIQFMHCATGGGPFGHQLLRAIANELSVPVSAGLFNQIGGSGTSTFRFEGPTFTAVPGGGTLNAWCRALPDFPHMSVP